MWSKVFNEDIERNEELKEKYCLTEFYELGIIKEKKIENADTGIVYELNDVLSCIIRDYLRLYNKVNLKANYPTAYLKALYPECDDVKDCMVDGCSNEDIDKWTDMVEDVAQKFDGLIRGGIPSQEEVDKAFDSLKKIFLGLWT